MVAISLLVSKSQVSKISTIASAIFWPVWSLNMGTISSVNAWSSHKLVMKCTVKLRQGWWALLVHRSVVAAKYASSLSLGLTTVTYVSLYSWGSSVSVKYLREGRLYLGFSLDTKCLKPQHTSRNVLYPVQLFLSQSSRYFDSIEICTPNLPSLF